MAVSMLDLCQYGRLAEAYLMISESVPADLEERTTNLLNHLIWGSYHSGEDPTNDDIAAAAIGLLFRSGQTTEDLRLLQLMDALEAEGMNVYEH